MYTRLSKTLIQISILNFSLTNQKTVPKPTHLPVLLQVLPEMTEATASEFTLCKLTSTPITHFWFLRTSKTSLDVDSINLISYPIVGLMFGSKLSSTNRHTILDLPTPVSWKRMRWVKRKKYLLADIKTTLCCKFRILEKLSWTGKFYKLWDTKGVFIKIQRIH